MGLIGRICVVLLAVVAAGCSADPASDEVETLDHQLGDLQLSDCFNDPASAEIDTVMVVPCSTEHDFEIYHSFELLDGEYPGPEQLKELWIQGCLLEFEPFVGVSFDESVLDISAIFPTEQSWLELDDREVLCSVTAVDGSPRQSSAEGSEA